MNTIKLELLQKADEEQFIKDNQFAFNYGAKQYFSEEELEEQNEEDGEIISRETILQSIHHEGAIAYRIVLNEQKVGGMVISINGEEGDLELLFVNPSVHNKGVGQAAWKEIERLYPNIKVWETVTPTFEKRNVNFYVNKLGFHIVEYFNKYHPSSRYGINMDEMFKFRKEIK